ncbi:MAG: ADP-ribosylglycohydrolase [uncultured Sulfurovum sp.]|uniref:ADP-ribosylglycohydrolase n=1 Tax=uncultured Sulfurovum sp. TaxID=269237 RepID=A0A6S6TXV3_9BACT|nr:MAG: ADP-ribosylglycohydrolase [uncultured Sulfurovum sp.]
MKEDKLKGLMWGSLLGDAYSLGGHWVYDQNELNNSQLNFKGLNNPLSSYHLEKKAGDFTHYGDQTVWLLEHINHAKIYEPYEYSQVWQKKMSNYKGYVDGASKESLGNLNNGASFMSAGSNSQDLSVIGRHAPIIFSISNMDDIVDFVKFHTCLTHMSKEMLDASKYIVEITLAMLYDLDLESTLKERAKFYGEVVEAEVKKAFELRDMPTNEAINTLGASCGMQGALASTIHLLLNYHDDFDALLKVNVLAGGDSSARAMVAGMIVGARYGFEAIKPSWIEEINDYERLNGFIG